jgi:flagellar basal-body rod protein FlgC
LVDAAYRSGMSSILSIATSGMLAAQQRLQVSAQNVANANSDGPLPSASASIQSQYAPAYAPQQVSQVATASGGTQALVSNVQPSTVAVSDPTAPYADNSGQVASPNVDLANEFVAQQIAQMEFVASAQVAHIYSQMMQTLMNIGT